MKNRVFGIFAMIGVLMLSGCYRENHSVFSYDFSREKWEANHPVYFYYPNQDTLCKRDMYISVRLGRAYRYDRLDLVVETTDPLNRYWSDTVSIPLTILTDRAVSMNYTDVETPYRMGVRFPNEGTYRIKLKHLMPESLLAGVGAVGIKIESSFHGKK